MNYCINKLIFGYYPYFVLIVFILGSLYRYEYNQYSWRSSSNQILSNNNVFMFGSNLFHVGIILILCGHFVGLLFPSSVYSLFISPSTKQKMAIFFGGSFGVLAVIGGALLIYRRFCDIRVKATSSFNDSMILVVIYIQLITGMLTLVISIHHLDGMVMMNLAHWAQGIVTFNLNADKFIINEHWLFKLHIFLGLSIFLIFPFTRLVHILSVPIRYLFRPGYQIVRRRFF